MQVITPNINTVLARWCGGAIRPAPARIACGKGAAGGRIACAKALQAGGRPFWPGRSLAVPDGQTSDRGCILYHSVQASPCSAFWAKTSFAPTPSPIIRI